MCYKRISHLTHPALTGWKHNFQSTQFNPQSAEHKVSVFPLCSGRQVFKGVRKCRDSHKQSDLTDMWPASAHACIITLATMSGSCVGEMYQTMDIKCRDSPIGWKMSHPGLLKGANLSSVH